MSGDAPSAAAQNAATPAENARGLDGSGPDRARALLRGLEALAGPYPPFDPEDTAGTPEEQFVHWLRAAVDAGVPEPHATTLSTVDEEGRPDARVLLLKDVSAEGWCFATSRLSVKGRQLAWRRQAALTFYWPLLGRQVRVRGPVSDLGVDVGKADFLARSSGARAVALLERQSSVLDAEQALGEALDEAGARLREDPDATAPSWAVYRLAASAVEFWQGDPGRRHTRLQYVQADGGWIKRRLWP